MTDFYGDINGQNVNHLVQWLLETLPTDPGATTSRFFFNDSEARMKVADGNGGYRSVAWLTDLLGLSNWKSPIKAATSIADGNIVLSGLQTIDDIILATGDYVLIKNQTNLAENGFYEVLAGAWTRIPEADINTEITNSMCIVEEGTENGGQIWKNTDSDPLVLETDDVHFVQLKMTVPMTDETVKVSISDTTEKYLRESFTNIDAVGDALNNLTNIQFLLESAGLNETLKLALDMSTYTGNIEMTGNLHVIGTTTLGDTNFDIGSTVNRDNTTQTGDTTYDNNYVATYDAGSTINQNGDTNYGATSNTTGIQNFDENYVAEYNGSEINYNPAATVISCSGVVGLPYSAPLDVNADSVNVNITYDNGGANEWTTVVSVNLLNSPLVVTDPGMTLPGEVTITYDGVNVDVTQTGGAEVATVEVCQIDEEGQPTTINNNGIVENYTGDNITNLADGSTITNNLDGDVNNNYGATYTETNDYTAGAEINNTGDVITNNTDYNSTTNNTNVTETNNSLFTPLGCSGILATPTDIAIGATATKSEVTIVYDNTAIDVLDTRTKTIEITELSGLITIVPNDNTMTGTFTVEWNTVSGNIEVRQLDGAGTSTADVCQFSGGLIVNENGTITNTTNAITNNTGGTTNNTGTTENYDATSNITNLGDTYLDNLVVNNITNVDGSPIAFGDVRTIVNIATHTALDKEYIVVTNALSPTIITLPAPSLTAKVHIKKLTGEDVQEISILPNGAELIDGFTGATMNINRTMYTFTAVAGNRYLGD